MLKKKVGLFKKKKKTNTKKPKNKQTKKTQTKKKNNTPHLTNPPHSERVKALLGRVWGFFFLTFFLYSTALNITMNFTSLYAPQANTRIANPI